MRKFDKNVAGRYRLTVALMLLLFAAAVASLIWWSYAPQSRLPLGLAGIFLVWLMVVGLISAARVYRHMIRPVLQISAYLKSLARGEMPPPLKLRSYGRISFPELIAAVNQLRDRMLDTSAKLRTMQEQELEEMRGEEGALLLNRLMTAMSREFYQPLNAINGCIYALKQNPAPDIRQELQEELQKYSDDISDRVSRISRMGALAARSAGGRVPESFETAALIHEIEQGARKFLRAERLKMTLRYPNDFPAKLQGDREELRQLLMLLVRAIGNAAVPGGSIEWTLAQAEHGLEFRFACSAYREITGDLPRIVEEYRAGKDGGLP
ncbi:MAG: HAMP domain-containing histidine kinase, partial [Lentisphaeria bacterium]|nr:HAMP domain-containing histidine kinase [Lentisphaeria bacterium]